MPFYFYTTYKRFPGLFKETNDMKQHKKKIYD